MTKSRNILPPRRRWLAWELTFLRKVYAEYFTEAIAAVLGCSAGRVHRKAMKLGLKKSHDTKAAVARLHASDPEHGGKTTRFKPGIVPANKGMRRPGWHSGRMRETQFAPGNTPHTWLPVGSLRVVTDGYLSCKLNDLPGRSDVRWKPVHRIVWEAAHGTVPAGHVVVFKPGRRTVDPALITLDALECISRTQLMARNTVQNLPEHLYEVVQLRRQLTTQINKRAKEES